MGCKKIILFGCGKVGYEALVSLGSEHIQFFCDNDAGLAGVERYGKKIISFQELKTKYPCAIVLICVYDGNLICDIAKQCEENGIEDYLAYTMVRELLEEHEKMLDFINDSRNRIQMRKQLWFSEIRKLKMQVTFFKNHADIRHLKPATGQLRSRQIECVKNTEEWLDKISGLQINPFLYAGNLLGYVRHGAFIPWDDDMDFGLIRSEYERLKEYCQMYLYTEKEFIEKGKSNKTGKIIANGLEDCYWVCFDDHLVIVYKGVGIDFFSFDYYAEDFAFSELMDYASKIKRQLKTILSSEERKKYIEAEMDENRQHSVEKSNRIYFGIDNMEMWNQYHRGKYIPAEVIFPLKKVLWEGAYFWIPNDPEELLHYEYENIWKFPEDAGVPVHLKTLGITESDKC